MLVELFGILNSTGVLFRFSENVHCGAADSVDNADRPDKRTYKQGYSVPEYEKKLDSHNNYQQESSSNMLHSETEGVFEAVWNGVFIPHNKGTHTAGKTAEKRRKEAHYQKGQAVFNLICNGKIKIR